MYQAMKENKYIGSDFDDFLREEGILDEIKEVVAKKILVFQMKKQEVDAVKLAEHLDLCDRR
jgi:hypothetical protein